STVTSRPFGIRTRSRSTSNTFPSKIRSLERRSGSVMSLLDASGFFARGDVIDDRLELGRQWRVELDATAIGRVREAQPARVQERPPEPHAPPQVVADAAMHAAVGLVADDRMSDRAQVDPDLVGSSGGNGDLDEGRTFEMAREGHPRHRVPRPAGPGRHLLPVAWIASDRRVDPPPRMNDAPDERHVLFLDLAI